MNKELLNVLDQLEREKGISKEVLLDAVKHALIVAAKKIAKIADSDEEVTVEIDEKTADMRVTVGGREMVSREFGRIAAQTARQVIIQKIREAEKDNLYNEFKNKEGDLISGVVYRIEHKAVILDLLGKAEGVIPSSFLSPLDKFKLGERVKAYICEVRRDKGAQIILSRKHEGLIKKLFELEVPEIYEGIVEVKAISREAGERTKIAVFSKDGKVDCVGACVGIRGSRVKNIVEELRGEKLDIVRWSEDIKEFIKGAMSPAVISKIDLNRDNKHAKLIVNHEQLSLAIGRRGQNVRLASKLVGWEIDVRSKEGMQEDINAIAALKSVGVKTSKTLIESGYDTLEKIASATAGKISELKGIGAKKAEKIVAEAKSIIKGEEKAKR